MRARRASSGILHAACQQAGLPSASLWAAVPHYIAASPNPKAALALVRKLEGLVGVAVDGSELELASADYERQVNVAVQSDPDVQAFVERLEQTASEEADDVPTSLPVRRVHRSRSAALSAPARRRGPWPGRRRPRLALRLSGPAAVDGLAGLAPLGHEATGGQ